MAQNHNPVSFRLDDQPEFEDVGVKFVGHVASPRGVELTTVEGHHTEDIAHTMTSMSWALHTFIKPPTGKFRIDSGGERPAWRSAFFPPGVPIVWRASPCIASICHFGPEFIDHLLQAEPGLGFDAINCVMAQGSDRLLYLGQQVFRESISPGFGATLFAQAVGMEIALEIVRCNRARALDQRPLRGGMAPWQMRRLESYLHEHLSGDLSLQSLAAMLSMSERHLSRVVKRDKGMGIHRWVVELRLAEAQRLLAKTMLPLHEIARRVAFKSPNAFSTAFRAACGLSPSEYRRLALK